MVFEGDRVATDAFLKTLLSKSYVYVLRHPDGRPFYVGRGVNRRALNHEAEALRNHPIGETNPFKCNVIRKIRREGGSVRYTIDSFFEEGLGAECDARETALIAEHGRLHEGGILTNLAPGTGGVSGRAPFSTARHSATLSGEPGDNPERAILNRFLKAIGPVDSVPIKPVRQIARILPTTPHPNARSPSLRCAYALIASASATGRQIKPGAHIPRSFSYQDVEAVIENGVARDILKAGMASLAPASNPRDECFMLSELQSKDLERLYGSEGLAERGLV